MRIQHNIAAMNAYRNYNINTSAVSKNLEKLSSGYKINRAGDDAAGLAISEKMRAQITGLDAATKNVKDGISLVKTAEGAMQEVQDMLNRMVYLATQSANGTYDNDVDRANLQKEVDQLQSEINRIADSANFNGIKLLDGSLDTTVKTTGDVNAIVDANVVADGQLGKDPQAGIYSIDLSNASFSGGAGGGDITLTVFGKQVTVDIDENKTLGGAELAEALKEQWDTDKLGEEFIDTNGFTMEASVEGDKLVFTMSNPPTSTWNTPAGTPGATWFAKTGTVTGNNAEEVTVTVEQEAVDTLTGRMYGQAKFELVSPDQADAAAGKIGVSDGTALTIGDTTYVFAVGSDSKYKGLANVVDLTDKTADSADLAKIAAQRLSNVAKDNASFKVGSKVTGGTITVTEKEGAVDYTKNNLAGTNDKGSLGITGTRDATAKDWAGLIKAGMVNDAAMGTALTLQIGDTSDSYNQLKVSIGDIHTAALGIDKINIATQAGAAAAVNTIKTAINNVSSIRGTLGATQNRLEHTSNNLSVMKENIQDAESTIRDTDIAEEMMSYTKNNILVQSAQAMLAQANQIPQGVLQLLG